MLDRNRLNTYILATDESERMRKIMCFTGEKAREGDRCYAPARHEKGVIMKSEKTLAGNAAIFPP